MSSKIHIPALHWTDRTTTPHRRCRIEVDETTARCFRRSDAGYELVAKLTRADADAPFDVTGISENMAATLLDMMDMEARSRRGEPIGEPLDDPQEEETFEERLARVMAEPHDGDGVRSWEDLTDEERAELERQLSTARKS